MSQYSAKEPELKYRRSRKQGFGFLGGVPIWFIIALVLALPTHFVMWSWFMFNGPELARSLAAEVVAYPEWLTSSLYFPFGIIVLALTEFVAILPLNIPVGIFGIRQYYALRNSKHFVATRGRGFAH